MRELGCKLGRILATSRTGLGRSVNQEISIEEFLNLQ